MKILIAGFFLVGKAMEALRGYNFKGLGWSALGRWCDQFLFQLENENMSDLTDDGLGSEFSWWCSAVSEFLLGRLLKENVRLANWERYPS